MALVRCIVALGLLVVAVGCRKTSSDQESPPASRPGAAPSSGERTPNARAANDTNAGAPDVAKPSPANDKTTGFEFGDLVHVAGKGEHEIEGENHWSPSYEGGAATAAELSHPYFTVATADGVAYVADKEGHAVRRIGPDGTISTWLGTSAPGNGSDSESRGTTVAVTLPNGLWLRGDGMLFVLDLGNGKIRRVAPNGMASTLATIDGGIDTGRGLWVADDEKTIYFAAKTELKRWTPAGVSVLADGFVSLGNLVVDTDDSLLFADRGGNRVYRRQTDGSVVPFAGNGLETGGGAGHPALESALLGPRSIAVLGSGRYMIATHLGRRLWGVEPDGKLVLVIDGATGRGSVSTEPGTVGVIRGLSRAPNGDLWLTHGDGGQIHVLRSP